MTMTPIILAACVACTVYYHDAYVNMCAHSLPHAACVAMWDGRTSDPLLGLTRLAFKRSFFVGWDGLASG